MVDIPPFEDGDEDGDEDGEGEGDNVGLYVGEESLFNLVTFLFGPG